MRPFEIQQRQVRTITYPEETGTAQPSSQAYNSGLGLTASDSVLCRELQPPSLAEQFHNQYDRHDEATSILNYPSRFDLDE